MPGPLNKYSSRITQRKSQGTSQAMLYGLGLTEEDMGKAQVGIASVWWEGNPCNVHLNDLAARVKEGVRAAGLVGWDAGPLENSVVVEGMTSILIGINKQFGVKASGIRITGVPRPD